MPNPEVAQGASRRFHWSERTTYPGGSHERVTEYEGDNLRLRDAVDLNRGGGFPLLRVISITGVIALLAVALNNAEGVVRAARLMFS